MFELRTLGSTDLRAGARGAVASVVAQPKRFALLCYLALGDARGGLVRRDSLLALFWPDSDAEHARNSLRQALFFLRRALGADCLLTRGSEEVGLAAACWRSDVTEFRRALGANDLEGALGWYGGDFLAGFNLSGLPEWEQWAAAERDRLRAQAADAAWALADAALHTGAPAAAAEWARRAAGYTPGEEEPLRRLLCLLDRIGDRAAAVQAYDAFARQLTEAWELQPSRETRALVADIRRRAVPTPAASAVVTLAPAVPSTPPVAPLAPPLDPPPTTPLPTAAALRAPEGAATPANSPDAAADGPQLPPPIARPASAIRRLSPDTRTSRWRQVVDRRSGRLVAALLLAAAAVATGGVRRNRDHELRAALPPTASAMRVAVFPFVVHGPGEWGYLSEGIADLLSAKLDGTGPLRSVDTRALFGALETPGGVQRPEIARAHATRLGANLYVLGSVVATGGRIQLRAGAYRMTGVQGLISNGGADLFDEVVVDGAASELPRLIDELTMRLTATQFQRPGDAFDRSAVLTTRSLPALKAFLDGERLFRAGDYGAAVDAFQRAATEDTSFALALYRLSTTAERGPRPGLVRDAIARALRHADRLSPADALVLRGHAAAVRGALEEAERLFRGAVALHPDDAEAWHQLGEVLFHTGPWRGRSVADAGAAFAQVLTLRPNDLNARVHMARLLAHAGRGAALDSLAAAPAGAPQDTAASEQTLELRALRAFAATDRAEQRRTLDAVRAAAGRQGYNSYDNPAWLLTSRVATFLDDPAAGLQLAAVLTASGMPARARLLGHAAAAHLEAARGRWRAARARLAAAEPLDPVYVAQVRANLAVLPFAPLPASEAAGASTRLARAATAPNDAVRDRLAAGRDDRRRVRVPYLLGRLALLRGETAVAAQLAEALDGVRREGGGDAELAHHFAQQLRARLRQAVGDTQGALAAVEAGWPVGGDGTGLPLFQGETYSHAAERYLRAELLAARGHPAEALAWYESVVEDLGASVALHAPAHLRQAELLERLGRPAEAVRHYRQVVTLWADADPELQPQVAAARRRAAALVAP